MQLPSVNALRLRCISMAALVALAALGWSAPRQQAHADEHSGILTAASVVADVPIELEVEVLPDYPNLAGDYLILNGRTHQDPLIVGR